LPISCPAAATSCQTFPPDSQSAVGAACTKKVARNPLSSSSGTRNSACRRPIVDGECHGTFDARGPERTERVRRSWAAGSDGELLALVDSACFAFRDRLADVFDFETEEGRIAPIGDMTTKDLTAYQHLVKGHDLTYAGYFEEGARELIKATQVDTQFALAYSITACTLSFAKQDSLSAHYFALAQRFAGDRLLTGSSLASLIFQGNSAWGAGDAKTCCDRYRLATELYPDEREDFLYHEL